MRVITAVYLHCRPELRDEWLSGGDVDAEVDSSVPMEMALRSLTHWYNLRNYADKMGADKKVLEEEQDWFSRELEDMEIPSMAQLGDGESVEEAAEWEGSMQVEGW